MILKSFANLPETRENWLKIVGTEWAVLWAGDDGGIMSLSMGSAETCELRMGDPAHLC